MRVMVTGAAGQLGSAVAQRHGDHLVVGFTRSQLDIGDEAAVRRAVASAEPDAIVNCAAYNDVDGGETNATGALLGNAFGVLYLARAARDAGATFIHYSTDFVFDGTAGRPYVETDQAAPMSTYGSSKLLGEWFASEAPEAYVLRVESLFGGPRAKSSIDKILASIQAGQPTRVFGDRTVTPSYVEDVVSVTEGILARRPPTGLYHCVNGGVTTWRGIAEEVARLLGREADIVSVNLADVKLVARRPLYCALSNEKLAAAGFELPSWQDALARYVALATHRQA
ncbi:MAG: NAD(P)-dependent oxidoreductase [Vicinamibacterales bacterium]